MKPVIDDQEIFSLYHSADKSQKILLERAFGREAFEIDLWEKIKSFEDGLKFKGLDEEDVLSTLPKIHRGTPREESRHALDKIEFLGDIFRAGWFPDWNNSNEYKYRPYFLASGSWLSFFGSAYDFSGTSVASRLYFPTREMSDQFGRQFISYYCDYILK